MALNLKRPEPVTHLYRGSPVVRAWSKYQRTIVEWSECGVYAWAGEKLRATAEPSGVSCPFCLELMQPPARTVAKNGTVAAEQDDGKVPW